MPFTSCVLQLAQPLPGQIRGTRKDACHMRIDMMRYAEVMVDEDMEIASGAVEGAVKYVIGKRCDQGGMRWIVERNEAVVQLRCIEVNGDWEHFTAFVHDRIRGQQVEDLSRIRISPEGGRAVTNARQTAEM